MRTARPTTGPAHAFLKLRHGSPDVLLPCFCLFDDSDPTNPFVPREWCYIFPCRQRVCIRFKRLTQIIGQIMNYASRDRLFRHVSLSDLMTSASFRARGPDEIPL